MHLAKTFVSYRISDYPVACECPKKTTLELPWNTFYKIVVKEKLESETRETFVFKNMASLTAGFSHHRFGCLALTTVAESKRHLPGEPSVLFPHGNLGRPGKIKWWTHESWANKTWVTFHKWLVTSLIQLCSITSNIGSITRVNSSQSTSDVVYICFRLLSKKGKKLITNHNLPSEILTSCLPTIICFSGVFWVDHSRSTTPCTWHMALPPGFWTNFFSR